jgi:hypothetical protein
MAGFWVVVPCVWQKVYQCFVSTCYLYIRVTIAMIIEAASTYEILVNFY